jgi:hypothetical protein
MEGMRLLAPIAAVVFLTSPARAFNSVREERPFNLSAELGGPSGFAGVAGDFALHERFALSIGLGYPPDLWNEPDAQHSRVLLPLRATAFPIGDQSALAVTGGVTFSTAGLSGRDGALRTGRVPRGVLFRTA